MTHKERYDITRFIGQKFNMLTVVEDLGKKNQSSVVRVRCECGKELVKNLTEVKTGSTRSCGCIRKLINKPPICTTHGFCGTPIYNVWAGMRARCLTKTNPYYPNYGGRGVKICDEWVNDAGAFCMWAMASGYKKGLELDKDKGSDGMLYSPERCSFISKRQNNWHKRNSKIISYKGELKSLGEWCYLLDLELGVTGARIRSGISVEKAFSIPTGTRLVAKRNPRPLVTRNGVTKTISRWCKELNAPYQKIRRRMDYHKTDFEEALKFYS